MDSIYALSLRGYCSLPLAVQYLQQVASQLVALHAQQQYHGAVDLRHVHIEDDRFILSAPVSSSGTAAGDVWQLAASTMELLLGTPLLNGRGEQAQTAHTPIPTLPQAEAERLNLLLQQCLHHDPTKRPAADQVLQTARQVALQLPPTKRPLRPSLATATETTTQAIDRQWPESMLASIKPLLLLLPLLLVATLSFAQPRLDPKQEELTRKLLDATLLLRQADQQNWTRARSEFEKRLAQFTLMDELRDRANDYPLAGNGIRTFGVNRIITALKDRSNRTVQNSGQRLLDGSDSRFSYSIYEKGVRAGRTATYTMRERYGKQVFLIVPHKADQAYSVTLVRANGTVIPPTGKDRDGVTYFIIDAAHAPKRGETLTMKLTNRSSKENASFVIINHNYRPTR